MNNRRLDKLHAGRDIPALSEVGVLIYGARDKAGDCGNFFDVMAEDEGEAGCKGGGRLHGGEGEFGNIVAMKRLVKGKENGA